MVLLKNEGSILPVAMGKRLALFVKGTFDCVKGGGGSGDVTVPYIRNLYDGFVKVVGEAAIFRDTADFYRENVSAQYAAGRVPDLTAEPELPDTLLQKARTFTDTAVVSISRYSDEGWDRKSEFDTVETHKGVERGDNVRLMDEIFEDGDFYLSHAERAMLEKVSAAFPKTVVVLNAGGMIETARLKEDPKIGAVLLAWQVGLEGGLAAAELIMGIGNPSGKLADTFAARLEDYPCADTFYDSDDYVDYYEDIYVGYRYFETIPGAAEKVVYPFGYGLSYTSFELTEQQVRLTETEVIASAKVLNAGDRAGKEVIQVYYSAPQGKLGKPAKALGGYRKTKLLAPGETQTITVRFPIDAMTSYDDLGKVQKSAWLLEKGDYNSLFDNPTRETVRNAFLLVMKQPLRSVASVAVTAIIIGCYGIGLLLFPNIAVFLGFLGFSLLILANCRILLPLYLPFFGK